MPESAVAPTVPVRGGIGVFASNRALPFHRWFPFVEGYSAELVERALSEGTPAGAIFDPFGGSGTTALTAALHGRDCYFTEVNPYMAWIADVKVNQARTVSASLGGVESLRGLAARCLDAPIPEVPSDHPLLAANAKRGFFDSGVAETIVGLLAWLAEHLDGAHLESAKLAVAASIIPASRMIRRTDLRRRTASDPKPIDAREAVAEKLNDIANDIEEHGHRIAGTATQLGTDVRGDWSAPSKIGLAVTSPPYLNGTNYCRNSKLELLSLGLITNERELTDLRVSSISAGINNVSRRRAVPTKFAGVEAVAEKLDAVAYDQRIPTLVRTYFADMAIGLAQMRRNSLRGARLLLDIGDSRYSGVHVPTHELLAEVASQRGWQLRDQEVIRTRRSFDGTQLVQVLLRFEAM